MVQFPTFLWGRRQRTCQDVGPEPEPGVCLVLQPQLLRLLVRTLVKPDMSGDVYMSASAEGLTLGPSA